MLTVRRFIALLWLSLVTTGTAHAYIDGGSAHLVIQGLIAAAAGMLYLVRNPRELWKAIKRFIKRDKS